MDTWNFPNLLYLLVTVSNLVGFLFDVERLNIGEYLLTTLPNSIPRSFHDWEINMNEGGEQ
jgi:hypothetical protein